MKNHFILFLLFLPFFVKSQSLTDSLKAYYPFNGNAQDASGFGHHGTPYNGALLSQDRFGNPNSAYYFDGIDDYVELLTSNKMHPMSFPVSIAAWVKVMGAGPYGLFASDNDAVGDYFGYWTQVANGQLGVSFGDSGPCTASYRRTKIATTPFGNNQWHLVVAVVRGPTDMDLYVDCTNVGGNYSGTGGNLAYSGLLIGQIGTFHCGTSLNYLYNGYMDDVRFYHRELSLTDVISLYNYPTPINGGLTVNLGNDTALCPPFSYSLNATANGASSYLWSTGQTTPTISITQSGTYWVAVNGGINCSQVRDTIVINSVNNISPLSLGNDTSLCPNNFSISLNANIPGSSTYLWSNGQTTPNINVTQFGVYWVNVTGPNCLTATDTIAINMINYPQTLDLGNDTILCTNNVSVLLDATTIGATSYLWTTNQTTPSITATQAGTYSVIVSGPNCIFDQDTITIKTIIYPQTLDLGKDTSICSYNLPITLAANTTGATSYLWSNGLTTPSINITQAGTYWVTLTGPNCVFEQDTITINTIAYQQNLDLGNDTILCVYDLPITLTANTLGASTYLWSTGETTSSISVHTPDIYGVTVTGPNCIFEQDSIIIKTHNPLQSALPDRIICENETITIDAGSTYMSYSWSSGETTQSINVSTTGIYSVQLFDGNCVVEDTIVVAKSSLPLPIAHFSFVSDFVSSHSGIQFTNETVNGITYSWSFGDGTYGTEENPFHSYPESGEFAIMLIAYNTDACSDTFVLADFVSIPAGSLYFPNIFTPNNDGKNDEFQAIGEGVSYFNMIIFDRWGTEIKTLNAITEKWDGQKNGKAAPEGTYTFIVNYQLNNGSSKQMGGTVILIR